MYYPAKYMTSPAIIPQCDAALFMDNRFLAITILVMSTVRER